VYLRSLRLRGFKSFPDPVEIRLEPGVAVVVGPNGSGKSNLADAIVWAAGSLSPTELRAEKPEDVIFAGSATRPAAEHCQVELVFDNADGQAPLDYAEISVARRVERGGEGEYLLNGAAVRRTDVVELLAEVGLGGEMHSLVGQGRVEQILVSKPAERRALVEEAAGLGKFKRQRHRADLKLARVATQVERARDLEQEVRKRLRPLALQASAAARAEKLRGEVEAIRARLAAGDLDVLDRRLAEVEERRAELAQERRRRDERLEGLLEERRRAEEELAEAGGRHEEATARLYRLRSAVERLDLRREWADEEARKLRAAAERRRAAQRERPTYERALAAARGWQASERGSLGDAFAALEHAQADGRDSLALVAGGDIWVAAASAAARRAPIPETLDAVAACAERLARALERSAAAAARFEAPLLAQVDSRGARSSELGETLRELGGAEAELRRAAAEIGERAAAAGIEAARLEAERDEIAARLPADATGEPVPEDERVELQATVDRLARRLEALGQVNPLAAEEHARESERLGELVRQREDLERSLEELERLRSELTETVERRFEETYAAVERHFAEVAATLFPGGSGKLTRTDEDEPGIEIELRPAGGRVARLSLLSGGEKALGAISFLFALFLARPCAFYLLDEVEAALDDTNIGRFVTLLHRFSDRAQFIVVTHQKRTMEAADILYGVTMGTDGTSEIVSKRLAGPALHAVGA
jgi:chromosome segregation ATPase